MIDVDDAGGMAGGDHHVGQILLIDDDPFIRFLLGEFLEKLGHSVVTAKDMEDAYCAVTSKEFDTIFVDLHFPTDEYNGFDIIGKIKQHQHQCPIIILTGDNNLDTAIRPYESGFLILSKSLLI